jgi:hypothetical protein
MQPSPPSRWPNSAIIVTVVLGLLVLMLGGWAVVGANRISDLDDQIEAARSDLDEAEDRIADLEDQLAEAASGGDLFGDLLGGGEGGDLGDLLGGLLGGDTEGLGGLEDLLGALLGGANLGDLGDLGDLEDLGDLGGLLGGLGASGDLGSCLTGAPGSYEIEDSSLDAQVADIATAVEDLRGLTFPSGIDPVFVDHEEMGERVRDLVEEGYPADLEDFDTRLLVALGMLPAGYDLMSAQMDLLDTGVAGYYDPDSGELVVATPESDQPLAAIDQITLAHEMIHALTDARLGIPDALEDPRADPEIIRAQQALTEGDATLGMQQFTLGALGFEEQMAMLMDPRVLGAQQEAANFPYVLSNGLQLPYVEGMNFTCALYADGGWEAVDAAYADPPTNTSQVLFPERYVQNRIEAVDPDPVGSPGGNWESLREVGFGAVDLLMLFSAPGDDTGAALSDPRERARAWGGGRAEVWSRGNDTAVGISLTDTGAGLEPLCDSMVSWELAAFPDHDAFDPNGLEELAHSGDGRAAVVVCDGPSVRVGIGPDLETARSVAGGRS